jgi:hypothetical protein
MVKHFWFKLTLILIALACYLHIKEHTDKFERQIKMIEGQVGQMERKVF